MVVQLDVERDARAEALELSAPLVAKVAVKTVVTKQTANASKIQRVLIFKYQIV